MTLGTSIFCILPGDTVKVCAARGVAPIGAVTTVVACLEDPARFVLAEYEDIAFERDEVEVVAYMRRVSRSDDQQNGV